MEKENIYEINLHETTRIFSGGWEISITRVHGGWIYTYATVDKMSSVFVPNNYKSEKS